MLKPTQDPEDQAQETANNQHLKAWIEVAHRRQEEVRSGKVKMVPGDEALARIRARIS